MIKLFPDRAIKASSFVDIFNNSYTVGGKSAIRIRNPLKKLAQDVDYA